MNMLSSSLEIDVRSHSVLVLTSGVISGLGIESRLQDAANLRVTSKSTKFSEMREQLAEEVRLHDALVFEVGQHDELSFEVLCGLLEDHVSNVVVIALSDDALPLNNVQLLLEAGVNQVLPVSIDADALKLILTSELERRQTPSAPESPSKTGKVVAVAKARGGVGATSVAVNLATSLKRNSEPGKKGTERRVILVDLDLQFGNAGVFLDIEDNGGILNLIESGREPDIQFVKGMIQTHSSGLDVISAPAAILPFQSLEAADVDSLINVLNDHYDYIVVDLPQAMVDWIDPILSRTDVLTIVTDTSVPSVRQTRRLIDFCKSEYFSLEIDLVVNREKRPLIRPHHVRQAEKILRRQFEYWLPDAPEASRHAVDVGQPIVTTKNRSKLGRAFTGMARTLEKKLKATGPAAGAKEV